MSEGIVHLRTAISARLQELTERSLLRKLSPNKFTSPITDLSHNDFLALRHDRTWQEHVWHKCRDLPLGSGASRLLGGEFPIFAHAEKDFATYKNAPSSLFFPSGYAANIACLTTLARACPSACFFSDELNHASIIDGLHLARIPRAQRVVYPHLNLSVLEQQLKASDADINIIVTESLFGMNGDFCDLVNLTKIAERQRGVLVIDEAHATGLYGEHGNGVISAQGIPHRDLISISTCGKALGVAGAFICAPPWFKSYLVNTARTFIYTTAPPPWIALAVQEAITYAKGLDERRARLFRTAARVREELVELNFAISDCSHIIPVLAKDTEQALRWAEVLANNEVIAPAIRPPTVPTARLRLAIHAGLNDEDLTRISTGLHKLKQMKV